jgi:hypothetical protein
VVYQSPLLLSSLLSILLISRSKKLMMYLFLEQLGAGQHCVVIWCYYFQFIFSSQATLIFLCASHHFIYHQNWSRNRSSFPVTINKLLLNTVSRQYWINKHSSENVISYIFRATILYLQKFNTNLLHSTFLLSVNSLICFGLTFWPSSGSFL